MPFDVAGARKAGYSDDEIARHLASSRSFDYDGAVKSGYSTPEIIDHLTKTEQAVTTDRQTEQVKTSPIAEVLSRTMFGGSPQQVAGVVDDVGTALANAPESAMNVGRAIANVVQHPVKTGKALVDVARGGLARGAETLGMTPTTKEYEPAFDAVKKFYVDRFGSVENLRHTITTDPVGFAMDLSTVLGLGATVTGAVGATKASAGLNTASRAVDPIRQATGLAKKVLKPVGRIASETLGMTTGTGRGSIQQALKGGHEFTQAMRGGTPGEDILSTAQSALQTIKSERAATYRPRLEEVGRVKRALDITPVKARLETMLKSFNVKDTTNGTFDFSRSTLAKSAQGEVAELAEMVRNWGSQADDLTPVMLDTLKRRLDDFYSESKNSRTIVASVRGEVKQLLDREVPGYAEMTKDYAKASRDITDIQKALSLGTQYGSDTALRKLTSVMRENFEFRKSMVDKLNAVAGEDLAAQIAGYNMQPWLPRGLVGKLIGGAEISAIAFKAADPTIAAALLTASPRVVGEFLNLVGKFYRGGQRVAEQVPPSIPQAAFQAGRIQSLEEARSK